LPVSLKNSKNSIFNDTELTDLNGGIVFALGYRYEVNEHIQTEKQLVVCVAMVHPFRVN
jgi:hypothetical protein